MKKAVSEKVAKKALTKKSAAKAVATTQLVV